MEQSGRNWVPGELIFHQNFAVLSLAADVFSSQLSSRTQSFTESKWTYKHGKAVSLYSKAWCCRRVNHNSWRTLHFSAVWRQRTSADRASSALRLSPKNATFSGWWMRILGVKTDFLDGVRDKTWTLTVIRNYGLNSRRAPNLPRMLSHGRNQISADNKARPLHINTLQIPT